MTSSHPKPSVTLNVKYIRSIDIDTYEVEVTRRFNVRLNGVDGFEKSTDIGKSGIAVVHNLLSSGNLITISIPTNDTTKLMDFHSFDRVVADVWVDGIFMKDKVTELGLRKPKDQEHLGPKSRQ